MNNPPHHVNPEWIRALDFVRTLDEARLAEFFYLATAGYREDRHLKDRRYIDCLALARCSHSIPSVANEAALVELIALPTKAAYDTGNAGEYDRFLESGDCNSCRIELSSVAKEAICPICEGEVGLT